MHPAPTGTVTFLFTDIQGSARLAQDYPADAPALFARHDAILHDAIACQNGIVFEIVGDAFCAAFATARDAFAAALDAQRTLQSEPWQPAPVAVRMGLHTGEAWVSVDEGRGTRYSGYLTLTRSQRVMSAAHGGQVLMSGVTADLLRGNLPPGVVLRDLGEHLLKGVASPERLWQMVVSGLQDTFPSLRILNKVPTNLPVQLTSFIGREREMGEIGQLMAGTRLLTLTGVGGTGKTRLALQVAANLTGELTGGAWLVDLASLKDGALVPQAVVSALGLHGQPGYALSDLLLDHLRHQHLLLVLDNCEHLVDACAELTGKLLAGAPWLQILATSRLPLNLPGEVVYPVPRLSVPDPRRPASPQELAQSEAARLFIARAQAARPAFSLTNANAPVVAQICQRLDGIPLAIELAAARMRVLSPDQISARLDDRFNLLTGGSRIALPRQQTLRAAMDWSYDLLTGAEREVFNRLAVFAGSFPLEAAEAVCSDESDAGEPGQGIGQPEVLDLLASLVEHSLVLSQETRRENRYGLLETVWRYALEKLQATSSFPSVQRRHVAYYLALAEQGDTAIRAGRPAWMERFETEYDNLRAAMAAALATDVKSAIRLGKSLASFALLSQRVYEAYGWATRLVELTEQWPPCGERAAVLWLAGRLATEQSNFERAEACLNASLQMARQLGDKQQIGESLHDLALMYLSRGQTDRTMRLADECITVARDIDDPLLTATALRTRASATLFAGDREGARLRFEEAVAIAERHDLPAQAAVALYGLGNVAHLHGDLARAEKYYTESALGFTRTRRLRWLGYALHDTAKIKLERGDYLEARRLCDEDCALVLELKDRPEENVRALMVYAGAAGLEGDDVRAARLFGVTEAVFQRTGWVPNTTSRRVYDPIMAAVRERLGKDSFDSAQAEGRRMTIEQALEYARGDAVTGAT